MQHAAAAAGIMSLGLTLGACTNDAGEENNETGISSSLGGDGDGDTDTESGGDGDGDTGVKLDALVGETDGMPCEENGNCVECDIPEHTACDQGTSDPILAIGLNCPGDPQFSAAVDGAPGASGVRAGFGNTATWDPREGSVYAVLGSGLVNELDSENNDWPLTSFPTYCNDDLGAYDPGATLPPPIVPTDVGGSGCADNPDLVGNGDCSNTIQEQWDQGGSGNDYTEIRIGGNVPMGVNSFSYDFAFFSTEYPDYYGSTFNDMYVAWLESDIWTGNVSFDEMGNPISLNAGFLDFRDDNQNLPEFAGTCMKEHAGTKWLSTTAGVVPGEDIEIVFAIFDLSDSILDSYVFIDNFVWGCDGDQPPSTVPID